ncbi:succinylglutamate desuccinylase/aspartoacylase family protein [Waterburya agarophytonicola K14]|uniref:Succinylglutamate desuccinylase/aspartoacylase family protein n=1 Tax=Waterburya agarophytonicola KI4 TaxID=2874699 RepID=A0A964BQ30_9CYAN|nr:succinylglutamate desuccinylase/aspartoacylase family protein [Waterburya agarophytonicola]MCC0177513.1 succinylglutamate desuccinylase/aspartoacylase family protein [Waterburya agarophytonicola KI4]
MIPHISTIDLYTLASGDILSLQVYKFIGYQPGKKAYIQANLHGAEIVGNAVIHQLIEFLTALDVSQLQGEIWLVPVCNPLGTNQRSHFFSTGRFNSYDGKNWNRIFWDYEKESEGLTEFAKSQINNPPEVIRSNYLKRIQQAWQEESQRINQPRSVPLSRQYRYQLQSLCLDADYVIDIHSSSNQAIDYTFGFQERIESAKYLLLEYGILMDEYDGDAFDEAFLKPWLALERELAILGEKIKFDLESWTLELGAGMAMNPTSVAKGVAGIKNYLAHKQILSLSESAKTTDITLVSKSKINSYYAPTGGMIQSRLSLNTKVKPGDIIYQLLNFNKQGKIPEVVSIAAETSGVVFDISTNQCVNQGEYVIDILSC